jgi:hypothetical protein
MAAELSVRRSARLKLAVLGAIVALVAIAGLSGSATASHPQTPLLYGCALKSNGLVRYVTDLSQCKPKQETSFAVWPGPTHLCIKPDGSVRKVNSPAECGTGPPSNRGTPLTIPSSTDAYFCAAATTGVLRYVTSPDQCTASETALVVANHAPTDIALSNSSVAENESVGTTVGTLSATDPDPAATFTLSLVAGAGDADNASFTIDGTTLKTNAVFDYETKNSYSIRVRVTDGYGGSREEQLTITITDVVENAAPTDIQLSNSTVAENQPGGTNVGTLTTTDPDAGDTHTYSLVAGAGDDDNAKFQISGSTLQTAQPLDFEADSSLSVRIRTNDGHGGTFEEAFTITVTNANDPPSDLALSNSSVAENQPAGTNVGTLSATDQDTGATHTVSLVAGAGDDDNAKFQISGSTLQTAQSLDFEADNSLTVRVRADDGAGGTFEKALTITVTNVNEAPTDIALSNSSVAENEPVGTTVGTISATDPDAGNTHTFALVAGAGDVDNASFQVDGSTLKTNAVFDFETKNSYSIRLRATDAGSLTFEKQFTITITNVNEPPTDINLSNQSIAENQPSGTAVGTLSTVDDPGSTHTYSLVAGAGDTDNASFQIDGDTLESAVVFDFEVKSSYSIRVRTDDGGGGTFEKQFTITITNANDAPSDIALSSASVNENEAVGTAVGTLSATDQDAGDTHTFALVSGAGDTDNASFQITGTSLKTNAVFNYEVKNSYSIRIRVTDSGSATHEEQFTISIVDVNDPPVANADGPYNGVIGNTVAVLGTTGSGPKVVLTGNVLINNDTDEDATFPHTLSAAAETPTSTGGGTATVDTDGSFTFLPGVGDKNQNDTFTYHVTDGTATTAGTVTVHIEDFLVWYVDNASAAATHDGRSPSPFLNLASLNAAGGSGDSDGTGDYIFLYQGSGSYGGGIPLEANQNLWGEKHGLTVNSVNLVAAGATAPVVTNASGTGVGLASGVDVQGLNISGTSGDAINGSAVTTATVGTTTAVNISSTGGDGVELSGAASGNISIASPITGSAGHSVSVSARSGGTVAFSGAVSDTGTGILLNGNTGATINLTGGVTASTGTSNAFSATGGGTVNVTGSANTLATTTGTALNVTNTTIGAGGLSFRSIAANGAVNGIVLNNTGASGGLSVAGNGGTCTSSGTCTGGTIQNTTGAGISLTSTTSPSFDRMFVQNTGDSGVKGTGVTNFSFTNGKIDNSGTANVVDASNIGFNASTGGADTNLSGVVTITGNTLTNAWYHGIGIRNTAGTIANLTISSNTFTSGTTTGGNFPSSIGSGIRVIAFGSASSAASITKATIDANKVNNFPGAVGIQVQCGNSSSAAAPSSTCGTPGNATNAIAMTTNEINKPGNGATTKTGAEGMIALVNGVGQGNFTITGNNIQQTTGTSISSSAFGNATVTETISNNTIVANNTVASQGIGVGTSTTASFGTDSPHLTATITGNTVSQADGNGILAVARDSSTGQLDVSIKNNTVAAPLSGVRPGIRVDAGSATGDNDVCADISGNTSAGSGGSLGIGLRKQGTSTTVNAFGIEGMAATSSPGVEAYVAGLNPAGGGVFLISATSGFTNCGTAP